MRIHKDNIRTFAISILSIVAVALLGFWVAGVFLSPKQISTTDPSYRAKATYPSDPITLTYWRTVDGPAVFEPIIKRWQEIHPNVEIKIINIPLGEYDRRLAEAANSGTLPDLFMLRSDWLPRYRASLKPAPRAIFDPQEYRRLFAPVVVKDLVQDDKVMAVSYGVPTLGLFYNADLFSKAGIDQPPTTWQQLLDANSKITTREGDGLLSSGIALGSSEIANASSIMPLLMIQNGAIMTNSPPTQATFQNLDPTGYPGSAKALEFYTSFAKPSKSNYSWSNGFGDSTKAFIDSRTAMIIDYPYRYLQIKSESPGLNFKMAKVPQANPSAAVNYSEYWAEAVSSTSSQPDIAWDFYNFMTSYEIMNLYSVPTMKPASRLDLALAQRQDSLIGSFAEQVPSAQNYYKGNSEDSDSAIREMISSTLSGFDPAISLRVGAQKVTSAISQYPY